MYKTLSRCARSSCGGVRFLCPLACVSGVFSDPSAPPAALAPEQRLHHSVGPGDVCGGGELCWLPLSQSITYSCHSPETPLHLLLRHKHPAQRVSEHSHSTPPLHPLFSPFLIFHLSDAPSQSPPAKEELFVIRFSFLEHWGSLFRHNCLLFLRMRLPSKVFIVWMLSVA